jgi:hypothetical protein
MFQEGMVEGNAVTIKLSGNCTLSKRLRLAIDAHLFPDGDNRITDLPDGALQLVFCHYKNA